MIELRHVAITYADAPAPVLRDLDFVVPEGELCLVVGPTGSGKTTLLGAINGLVPHFTGGHLAGRVIVDGRDTREHPPRDLADVVGMVGQDPLAGFVMDTVEEELAYAMEQLAVPEPVMRKRVEETLDLLGIAELRGRALRTLSGGQQQRVAIGSVLTAHPRILVLDEPTSALDPTAAEEVLAAITRLVHDLGITVVMAEHRLERVVQYADSVVLLEAGSARLAPTRALRTSPLAPPVVQLGRLAGWDPLPMSVRDARRQAGPLRERLHGLVPAAAQPGQRPDGPQAGGGGLDGRGLVVRYGDLVALRRVDLAVPRGTVVAVMGRNGSGKSSLLWALHPAGHRQAGSVTVDGTDPAAGLRSPVAVVPQTPADLLYLATVDEECARADEETGADPGTCRALAERIVPGLPGDHHPRDLSEGQRLGLVLAVQLTASPAVVLLDEPTRGLDHLVKEELTRLLRELAAAGHAVVVATHDVEFVAGAADRVVVLADGEIVADGPTAEVVVASPAFAPQVAKVLQPDRWLTVDEIAIALAGAPAP
ncbi:MAG: ATP-binding cassette domain-containing protein [Acidimicrobiales bacterium]